MALGLTLRLAELLSNKKPMAGGRASRPTLTIWSDPHALIRILSRPPARTVWRAAPGPNGAADPIPSHPPAASLSDPLFPPRGPPSQGSQRRLCRAFGESSSPAACHRRWGLEGLASGPPPCPLGPGGGGGGAFPAARDGGEPPPPLPSPPAPGAAPEPPPRPPGGAAPSRIGERGARRGSGAHWLARSGLGAGRRFLTGGAGRRERCAGRAAASRAAARHERGERPLRRARGGRGGRPPQSLGKPAGEAGERAALGVERNLPFSKGGWGGPGASRAGRPLRVGWTCRRSWWTWAVSLRWAGSLKSVASLQPCLLINASPPQVRMLLRCIKQGSLLPFEGPCTPVKNPLLKKNQ